MRSYRGAFDLWVICLIALLIFSACGAPAPTASPPTATPILLPTQTPTSVPVTSTPTAPTPHPTADIQSLPDMQPAIAAGLGFLESQFKPEWGLLRESPDSFPNRIWLTTDNLLAIYAYDGTGNPVLADTLRMSMDSYEPAHHGLIEALTGVEVDWPPRTASQIVVASQRDPAAESSSVVTTTVMLETRNGDIFEDWEGYVDLAFYGALNAHNHGDVAEAQARYAAAIAQFDGVGFPDNAYQAGHQDAEGNKVQHYATYKLALALYVGDAIGQPLNPQILTLLLSKQDDESGGFITLYDQAGVPQGDANTETTAYALLALSSLMQ